MSTKTYSMQKIAVMAREKSQARIPWACRFRKVDQRVDALTGGAADSLPLQLFGRRMASGTYEPVLVDVALILKDLSAISTLERRYPR